MERKRELYILLRFCGMRWHENLSLYPSPGPVCNNRQFNFIGFYFFCIRFERESLIYSICNRIMKKFLILLVVLAICFFSHSQTIPIVDYLHQTLPGKIPKIFASRVVSNGFANRDFTISPAGDEIFFTIQQRDLVSVVMNSTKRNGKWSEPAVASFSGIYNDLE